MIKKGSTIIIVFFLLSALTIIGITILRNTTFLMDGAIAYEQYEKQYRATEALVYYGITIAQNNFAQIKSKKKYTFNNWPGHDQLYSGKLIFLPNNDEMTIIAKLKRDGVIFCQVSSKLIRNPENYYIIKDWKIG